MMKNNAINKEIFELLNNTERRVANLYYGVNEEKSDSKTIAKKLNMSIEYIDFIIESIKDKINRYYSDKKAQIDYYSKKKNKDDFYQVEKIDEKTSKLIIQMSDAFFSLFKNADPILVEESLKILPKKSRDIIILFYGLDGIHCLDYDELCAKFNITEDYIDKTIENCIKKVKSHIETGRTTKIMTSYGNGLQTKENKYLGLIDKYGKKRVDDIYLNLTDNEKEMIYLFYGESPKTSKEIAEKFGISPTKAYTLIANIINKIELLLQYEESRQTSSEFYNKFEGYSHEEIDGLLKQLNTNNQEIVKYFYGIGCVPRSIDDLCQNYDYTNFQIVSLIEEAIIKIKRKLELLDKIDTNKFYKKFEGYTKEEIDSILINLSDKDKEIISLSYGLDGIKMSKGQISNKYSTSIEEINKCIAKTVKKIKKLLKAPKALIIEDKNNKDISNNTLVVTETDNKNNRLKNKTNKYEELINTYGAEKIEQALNVLNDRTKEMIFLYYGINCTPLLQKDISIKYNLSCAAISSMIKNGLKKVENFIINPPKNITKEKDIREKSNEYEELVIKYGKEKVDFCMACLKDKEREIIKLHFGIDCEKITNKSISEKFNINYNSIGINIRNSIKKLQNLLENQVLPTNDKTLKKATYKENDTLLHEYLVNGDKDAYVKLMEVNNGLVYKILKNIYTGDEEKINDFMDEYSAIAFIGLSKAITTFDANKIGKIKFATYASVVIRNEVYMEFRKSRKEVDIISYEQDVDDTENISLKDMLVDEENFVEDVIKKDYDSYKSKMIENALNNLNDNERRIIELHFGFNCEPISEVEIAKMIGISRSYVSRIIANAKEKLAINLSDFKEEYKVDRTHSKNKELISKMNKVFYSLFDEKDKKIIQSRMIKLLSKSSLKVISDYYGLNHIDCKDYDEIAHEMNITVDEVDKIIEEAIITIKNSRKYNDSAEFSFAKKYSNIVSKNGKDNFLIALEMIDSKQKKYLEMFFGINTKAISCNNIVEISGISKSRLHQTINNGLEEIENTLENKKDLLNRCQRFYEKFKDYSIEEITLAISKLDDESNELIKEYYSLNGIFIKTDVIAEKYNLNKATLQSKILRINKKIYNLLKNPKELISKKDKFYKMFEQYNAGEIDSALNSLKEGDKEIIKLYFGLDKYCLTQQEIAHKFNIPTSTVSVKIKNNLKKIEDFFKNSPSTKEKFYEIFKGHTQEEIDKAISHLSPNSKSIINLLYGLNGEILTSKEIADRLGMSQNNIYVNRKNSIDKIKKILDKPEIPPKVERKTKNNKYLELVNKYGEEKVKNIFPILNDNAKSIMSLYFGIDCNPLPAKEIAKQLGISENLVFYHTKKGIEKLEQHLINPSLTEDKKKAFYSIFIDYSREEIDSVFSKLDEKSRNIISLSYGLNGECLSLSKIGVIYNVSPSSINVTKKRIINRIKIMLENPTIIEENNKYEKLINKYGKEKVEEAFSKLEDKTQKIMKFYFGIETKKLTSKEIAELYNCKENSVFYHATKGIKKLEEKILNPYVNAKKDTRFDELKKKYGQENIEEVLSILDETNLNILKSYFGIDTPPMSQIKIGEKYNITSNSISARIKKSLNKVVDLLENPDKRFEKSQTFYNKFEGFTVKQIIEAIEMLDEKDRNLIVDYNGLNGVKVLSGSSIGKKYDIPIGSVYSHINRIENKIKKILYNKVPNSKSEDSRKDELYRNLMGYSKKKIIAAINELNPVNRGIMRLYFGIDCEEVSKEEICRQFNCDETSINSAITYSFSFIKGLLSNKKEIVKEKQETDRKDKFNKLINKYGEHGVYNILGTLTEAEQAFLAMYYTLGNIKNYTLDEISKKINVDEKKLSFLEEKILEKVISILDNNKKTLIDKMRRKFFEDVTIEDKSKIKDAIKSLKDNEIKWIATYYGLNGKDIMTIDEMSKRFNLDKKAIENYIANIIKKLNSYNPSQGR